MVENKKKSIPSNTAQWQACARCLAGRCDLQLPRTMAEVLLVEVQQNNLGRENGVLDNPSLQHMAVEVYLGEIQEV